MKEKYSVEKEEELFIDIILGFEKKNLKRFNTKMHEYYMSDQYGPFQEYYNNNKDQLEQEIYFVYEFVFALRREDTDYAYMIIEQFSTQELNDVYLFFILILGMAKSLDVRSYAAFNNDLMMTVFDAYELYFLKQYENSYEKISQVNLFSQFQNLSNLLTLLNLVQLELFKEGELIYNQLKSQNPGNYLLDFLQADLFYKMKKYDKAYSIYYKRKEFLFRFPELRTNFLFLCQKLNKTDSYLKIFYHFPELSSDEIFELAKYFHFKGILNDAQKYYLKLDPSKYPVNKMLAVIMLQTDNYPEAYKLFQKEEELRGIDFDIKKYKKFIELSLKWKNKL